jgi:hypothetical protein
MGGAWGRREMRTKFGSEKLEGKRHVGRSKCEWEDSTEMDLKYDGKERTEFISLRIGPMTLSCEHDDFPSCSVKCRYYLGLMRKCYLLGDCKPRGKLGC